MKFQPIDDKVLVKRDPLAESVERGIIIPTAVKDPPQVGTVIAVGDGRYEAGLKLPLRVQPGDRVLFTKYGHNEIFLKNDETGEEEELLLMSEEEILGVFPS